MIRAANHPGPSPSLCKPGHEGIHVTGNADRDDPRLENQRTLVIALIETATGIANADAILSVPGIDVGWLGHYDLTNTMGMTAEFDRPEFHAAVDTCLAACRRHGADRAPRSDGSRVADCPRAHDRRALHRT